MITTVEEKLDTLQQILEKQEKVLIGYSGGVDSTFLLAFAKKTLGNNVLAVTISSPLTPKNEILQATEYAKKLGVPHKTITLNTLKKTQIKNNHKNRCYECKKMIFIQLKKIALQKNNLKVIEGTTIDDSIEFRPGKKALEELNIHSPLKEVGLTKKEIRTVSKQMHLPTWNKPAAPCLATRFPYDTIITKTKLKQVEEAEEYIKSLGFPILRLRYHDNLARIEVPKEDIPMLIKNSKKIQNKLHAIGYKFITVDLAGYQSGCYDGEIIK